MWSSNPDCTSFYRSRLTTYLTAVELQSWLYQFLQILMEDLIWQTSLAEYHSGVNYRLEHSSCYTCYTERNSNIANVSLMVLDGAGKAIQMAKIWTGIGIDHQQNLLMTNVIRLEYQHRCKKCIDAFGPY